ncbi:hypothetical protein niasHT_021960 [Heterodera trifolii]|uniref:Peptidase M14 domain-containing protein n=1 Tax=Heterodera trifolii TaxID=157864 RepID=A0ABD2K025_9BILA
MDNKMRGEKEKEVTMAFGVSRTTIAKWKCQLGKRGDDQWSEEEAANEQMDTSDEGTENLDGEEDGHQPMAHEDNANANENDSENAKYSENDSENANYSENDSENANYSENDTQIGAKESLGELFVQNPYFIGSPVSDTNKRIVWIDGAMHVREWASIHTALWFSDQWFQYFNSNGPQWLILLRIGCLLSFVDNPCFNVKFGIVFLRGSYKILIAMESAFAMILDLGYYVSFLVVISGIKFIRYEYCFWFIIVPDVLGDMAQMTMVFTRVL